MSKISLLRLAKGESVLAGASSGRRTRERLWDLAKSSSAGLFVIDCAGVDVATSSFLREGVVGFRDIARQERSDLYPVLSNLSANVEEEFVGLLNQMGEAFWVFELSKDIVKKRRLIGRIDPKLKETLELIENGSGHDAATLWKNTNSIESIGVTAWNNRLASLSKQGLVFESRVGKQKYFHPLHTCKS
jgi:hypothetical protein